MSPSHRSLFLLVGLVLGAISACFDAPADDVLFSCSSGSEPACPEGYSCESDGCCHKAGSDVQANLGGCALGFGSETSGSGSPAETGDESG